MSLEWAVGSDIGRRRVTNEDAVYAAGAPHGEAALLLVADGMGGHAAGEIASQAAIASFRECAEARLHAIAAPADGEVRALLSEGVTEANNRVHQQSRQRREWQGMGTTLVVAYLAGDRVWIGNVGDSRAYLVRGPAIRRLTRDHTLVEEAVQAGRITPAQAVVHPARNILTRTVGTEGSVSVDLVGPISLATGDVVLLASDGMHGILSDTEIAALVTGRALSEAVEQLIHAANARGGPDNISVAVARRPTVIAEQPAAGG